MTIKLPNYDQIKASYKALGYTFDERHLACNIFGIRNKENVVDAFNDIIGMAQLDIIANKPIIHLYAGTTDPGSAFLNDKLMNEEGTFIMAPGFYPNIWAIGMHAGKYEALIQARAGFKGWRDKNKDGKIDMTGPLYTDAAGVDHHTTNFLTDAEKVGPYSAGCQVVQHHNDFLNLMPLYHIHYQKYGGLFSYALFAEDQIKV